MLGVKSLPGRPLQELCDFLEGDVEKFSVVVMPDFFLDRIVSLDCSSEAFANLLGEVVKRKGGSIDGIEQMELRGGNAVNTASALAALGVEVTPIVCTNRLGLELMKIYLRPHEVDFSHVKIFENASMTTSMEFGTTKGKVNVMLRDVGALGEFASNHLDNEDLKVIEDADYVCVFNWAGTRRSGTDLTETVLRRVKERGRGKTYIDTADPAPNKEKVPQLVQRVLKGRLVDILSVNENEAVCYASQFHDEMEGTKATLITSDLAKENARILASNIQARIDLHCTGFSGTFSEDSETVVSTFDVPVLRATGAGDAWNAGNILADAHDLPDGHRLALANAVAAYYISNPAGVHATRKQLVNFCKKFL